MTFRGSLQDIRLFVAAYEERSFTAAASRENTTQSGVSHHVRQLEMLLRVKLFVREKQGVRPTPAAELLYQQCISTLRGIDGAVRRLSRFSSGPHGMLTIGMAPVATHRLAAPTLLRFTEQNPNMQVRLIEGVGEVFLQMVRSGEIDFAVGTTLGREGLHARKLITVPECLISRASGNPQGDEASEKNIKLVLPELKARRLAAIKSQLASERITVESELHINSGLAILDLVGRSEWKTIVPSLVIDPVSDMDKFHVQPFATEELTLSVYLLESASRTLPPEAEDFVDILVDEARKVDAVWRERFAAARDPAGIGHHPALAVPEPVATHQATPSAS